MEAGELDRRSSEILGAVVHAYVMSAQPVGSRTIAKRFNLNLSAATIRNVMADLEEMGYLMQPHTSAGRIPTDKGYRYFVDRLMEARQLSRAEKARIQQRIDQKREDVDGLMEETSALLSGVSSLAALVMGPYVDRTCLHRLELVHIMRNRLLAVFVGESGVVRERLVTLERDTSPSELQVASRFVNEHFAGRMVADIRLALESMLRDPAAWSSAETRAAVEIAAEALAAEAAERDQSVQLHIGGRSKIIEQPEFSDVERTREVIRAFEDKRRLIELLSRRGDKSGRQDVHIAIGGENPNDMRAVSVVSCRYYSGGTHLGTVGVLGPTRMDYSRVVTIVGYTSKLLSDVLSADGAAQ